MSKNKQVLAYDFPKVGCYVDASAQSADTCNLRTIQFAEAYGFTYEALPAEDTEDYGQILSETGDDAVEFLNDLETRSFMSWQFEDNSLFLLADVDGAREDVGFVTGKDGRDYPEDDYTGEWLSVSDHGNATLYVRSLVDGKPVDTEVWGVV